MQQKHVLHAAVAQYVTEQYLQRRYPTRGHAAAVANVDLPVEAFASGPRAAPAGAERTIAFVGTFDVMYKAPDVLLRAMQRCVATGLDLRLEFVGEGRHRQAMQALAADLGIADRVEFHGRVRAGKDVRDILDRVDLFVHPSRTEGLPRALLEAMARALPCVATRVGGIPELIEDRYLVSPGEVEELSRKLLEVLSDPARMAAASARNLERSRDYSTVSLSQKREAAYRELLRRSAGGQR